MEKIKTHKFVTYKEITKIVSKIEDYRDRALLMLIFDGFYTKMEDIQNLRGSMMKEEHTRYRHINGHEISGTTFRVINRALREQEIHTYSKFLNGIDKLIPSDYILRERQAYLNRSDIEVGDNFNGFAMNKQSIINRFAKIKKLYGFEFSLSSLYASGCIYRGAKAIANESTRPRLDFRKHLEEKEGVSSGMAYVYYKEYVKMKPRLEEEEEGR